MDSQHLPVFPCSLWGTFYWPISKSNSLSNKLKCWQYQRRHSEDFLFYFFMKICYLFCLFLGETSKLYSNFTCSRRGVLQVLPPSLWEWKQAGNKQRLAFPRDRSIFLASQQLGFTLLEQGWGEKQVSPAIPRAQSNAQTQTCMGRAGSLHSVLLFPWEKCPNDKVGWECVEAPAKDISRWGQHHLRNLERADKSTKYLECWETCLGKKAQRKALRN